jgi:LmbE family N-acetylglucosaminyl deacetylase
LHGNKAIIVALDSLGMETLPPLAPTVVLGVAAHPDDLDFMAAGTIASFARAGAACYYLILTDGSSGSKDRNIAPADLAYLRRAEQRAAGACIGLVDVFFRDYRDGLLEVSLPVKRDICRVIRRVKPDLVITADPSVLFAPTLGFINHPDHRAAGQATLDAVFPLARDHLSFPELLHEQLEPHETAHILLSNMLAPNFAIDITDTLDQKLAALAEHKSQINESTGRFVASRAAQTGKDFGYSYAEGFVRIDVTA